MQSTTEACILSITTRSEADELELEILLEAARRATWDALHGPMHSRSGRLQPRLEDTESGSDAVALRTSAAAPRSEPVVPQAEPQIRGMRGRR